MSRKSQKPTHFLLTANNLLNGDVVFWGDKAAWTQNFADALVMSDETAEKELLEIGQKEENENIVVGAYIVPLIQEQDGQYKPVELRELRRCEGPSILDHIKAGHVA